MPNQLHSQDQESADLTLSNLKQQRSTSLIHASYLAPTLSLILTLSPIPTLPLPFTLTHTFTPSHPLTIAGLKERATVLAFTDNLC